jgi:hypothetical protein
MKQETNTAGTFGTTSSETFTFTPVALTTTPTPFPITGTLPNGEIPISAVQPNYIDYTSITSSASFWGYPEQLEVNEVGESIEIIYKETSNVYRTGGLPPYNDSRIFKIVYSCVDGKWNKSEPIYGKIVPAQEEYYDFDL